MSHPAIPYATYDVFTTTPFAGNPLGVVHIPSTATLSQSQKQTIAREFNYSESIFLHWQHAAPDPINPSSTLKPNDDNTWRLDIFMTTEELPFAGHPTIGAACTLGELFPNLTNATLVTKAGPIAVQLLRNGTTGHCRAVASIPHNVHVHDKRLQRDTMLRVQPALTDRLEALVDGEAGSRVVSIVKGMTFAVIRLSDLAALDLVELYGEPAAGLVELDAAWKPSFVGLYFYVVHEEQSTKERLVVSCRMVEQGLEDPATGSAASALASFLALEIGKSGKGGKFEFEITQGVRMGRKSVIRVEVVLEEDGGKVKEVLLSGEAVKVMAGVLM